jgi:phage terminase large subunit GpA-like protein
VDVQDDRLEVQVVGWGREWNSFGGIDWLALPGDTSRDEPWLALYEYLRRPFANRFGRELRIEATAIDTGGHRTHEAYRFVRSRGRLRDTDTENLRRLMAVKGANTPGKPILVPRPQAQDVNWRGKVIKGGVMLWTVGTDTAKHNLFGRLTGDAGIEAERRKLRFGAGLEEDYFQQLTAEAFDPERNRWVKRRGRRNEGMDTWVYAAAASQHPEIRAHARRARDWAHLEQLLEPQEAATPETPPPAAEAPNAGRRQISAGVKKGGFVNRWKR